ncbi:hypothetical protein GGI25_003949 [Coemansia spiralis]|uniref:Uncharacterized protein n=2 Tax=Coemansia TaxID=4863 RepID=A0A9W8G1A3_9FUNG|nr:hypothetical protein EDC05_005679 [Coemansia umbellata]KAJ2620961.1 hypothetical protein GGI26_004567 [Coemansia sp. RSA 1358]KAJ2675532.1 hypothetical protein GGI25_003949 [Coemansia spiralis]
MSRYDSLDGNAFGGGDLHMSDAYSSTYSVSKWRDSALQIPGSPGSHASIPIIFSAEYSLDQLNSNGAGPSINRETRLYNATAASDETQQWATPNVVNIKQKPQLVVLGATSPSTSVPLEINTTNIRDKQPESETNAGVASASDEESPATPLSPETPVSMTSITKASAPAKTQMPRIVQIGNPQATRALEATTQQPQLAPGSPLRAMTHGWDSESDLSDSGESEAESFAPATGTSRPESQVDNKNITRLTLGAGLPFGGDGEDSFSKEVLGATGSIGLGNENTKS